MRITLRRVAWLVAIAAAPLAACDLAKSTAPGINPATGPAPSHTEISAPPGVMPRSCPEIRIPEHPCRDLP